MDDLTQSVLDGTFQPDPDTLTYNNDEASMCGFNPKITLVMLNRRPDIKRAIMGELEDLFLQWDDVKTEDKPEPVDFYDNQLLNALNTDPHVQAMVLESLLELDDCADREGEAVYRPSILDTDTIEPGVQYREDYDEVPAKYAHLSNASLDLIYSDPQVRVLISNMTADKITDALIKKLSSN